MRFRYFVIRQLLDVAGESYIKDIIDDATLNSLVPEDIQKAFASFVVPDVFDMFGQGCYKDAKQLLEKEIEQTDESLALLVQTFTEVI